VRPALREAQVTQTWLLRSGSDASTRLPTISAGVPARAALAGAWEWAIIPPRV